MLSVFPGWNANAGRENILKSADAVHFFNRRFEQTFHGYSDESSAKELSREKKTERVAAHRREGGRGSIARYSDKFPTNINPDLSLRPINGLRRERRQSEELRGNFGLRGNNRLDTGEKRKNITTPKKLHESTTTVERNISSFDTASGRSPVQRLKVH